MSFNFQNFGWRSFRYYLRTNLAIAAAVAIATAVLTGALIIGSSMRGSLRELTIERLGRIDEILVGEGFFSESLADRVSQTDVFQNHYSLAEPIIFFPNGSAQREQTGTPKRAGQVTLLGVRPTFWQLDESLQIQTPPLSERLVPGSVIINQNLATELGVTAADLAQGEVLIDLRVPKPSLLPGDSSLGRKRDLAETLPRLKVVAIIENRGLGRFAPHPSPEIPRLAFLALPELQQTLHDTSLKHRDSSQFANQLLIAGRDPRRPPNAEISAQLAATLQFSLDDLGIKLKTVRSEFSGSEPATTIFDYQSLSTERLVFRQPLAAWIRQQWPAAEPIFTYLVNNTRRKPNPSAPDSDQTHPGIPYSMFTALPSNSAIGLVSAISGKPIVPPQGDQVILNEWAAADLQAKPGDRIILTYFEPESSYGQQIERSIEVELSDIAKLTEPVAPFAYRRRQPLLPPKFNEPPTTANDPDLTPEVPGVTDAESMENWDLPFETSDKIRAADDEYWANHRTTPKGFVSLELGQKLWSSRFGDVTSFRLPATLAPQQLLTQLNDQWQKHPQWFGLQWVAIKRQGLQAASGSTPFDGLFLGLSLFVIVAGLVLVSLLFRLNLEQRYQQIGVARAIGFDSRGIARLTLQESLLVTLLGGAVGIGLGFLYAQTIIGILTTWWVGAISQPFLSMHWQGWEPLVGMASGVVISLVTMLWAISRTARRPVRGLLMGQVNEAGRLPHQRSGPRWPWVPLLLTAAALALAVFAATSGGEVQAGAFMGSGFLVLVAILLSIRSWLNRGVQAAAWHALSLGRLAVYSLRRNPGRSLLTIGLMAVATFMIVAISSFRLRPTDQSTGGMEFVGTSSQSVFADLNSVAGRAEALGQEFHLPDSTKIFSWRLKPGEDASCNNPYQSTQPRILGVTPDWIAHWDTANPAAIRWSGSLATSAEERQNPWRLLDAQHAAASANSKVATAGSADSTRPIPVVIDKNTAMFSLKIYSVGQQFQLSYDSGETLTFQVVGFLENSVLQGSLLIAEADFVAQFPSLSGYRYFLIDTGAEEQAAVVDLLRDRLADQGFDARRSREILSELMAVQNTYLTAFQSLGGLGLLLGTFGLAAVQLRSIMERRQELGLLRALGFSYGRLTWLLFWEQMALLLLGLFGGCFAALCTTIPHYVWGGASIPWTALAVILGTVTGIGMLSGWWSARRVIRLPLLASLKSQ